MATLCPVVGPSSDDGNEAPPVASGVANEARGAVDDIAVVAAAAVATVAVELADGLVGDDDG